MTETSRSDGDAIARAAGIDVAARLEEAAGRQPTRTGRALAAMRRELDQGVANARLEGSPAPDRQMERILELYADGRLTHAEMIELCMARAAQGAGLAADPD